MMLGNSPAFHTMKTRLERVAQSRLPCLLTGETGTGKELAAQYIHEQSQRTGPFIAVNCAAIPENLLESELFGHEKGSFTDARQARMGKFRAAHRGTLFLDEIGECSLGMQAKLLRVLQEQEVAPVGSDRAVEVDVRIIAATNRDLSVLTIERKFREDLYYRLSVLTVHLPPLREREDDIAFLAQHFCEQSGQFTTITPEAMAALKRYTWPGNIRELYNVIMQCGVFREGHTLRIEDLPPQCLQLAAPIYAHRLPEEGFSVTKVLQEIESRFFLQAMARTAGNKAKAARLLGMNRTTFLFRLRYLGLEHTDGKGKNLRDAATDDRGMDTHAAVH